MCRSIFSSVYKKKKVARKASSDPFHSMVHPSGDSAAAAFISLNVMQQNTLFELYLSP